MLFYFNTNMGKLEKNNDNGLSFIEKYNPFLEDKEDFKNKIENSDILPGSKKFLYKRLEQYSNNDNNDLKEDLNSNEIVKIEKLIKQYDKIENKYQSFRKNVIDNYSNLIKSYKTEGYIERNYGDGNNITENISLDEKIVEENKYLKEIENKLNNLNIKNLDTFNIEEYLNKKEEKFSNLDKLYDSLKSDIFFLSDIGHLNNDFYNLLIDNNVHSSNKDLKTYKEGINKSLLELKEKNKKNDSIEDISKLAVEYNFGDEKYITSINMASLEDKKIYNLVLKILGKKENQIQRSDINSLGFLGKLFMLKYNKKINNDNIKDVLIEGYYVGFKNEIKFGEGKKGIETIRKNEKIWKKIFDKNLKDVISNKGLRENLFLLSWIESSGVAKAKSEKNAQGYFQMLPATAKKYGMKNKSDLSDPVKSAEIASKYLKTLILEIKREYPLIKKEEDIISSAIIKYNGNWTRRLKENFQKDTLETIYKITKELSFIKSNFLGEGKEKIAIKKIQNTHDIFFNNKKTHFSILEKRNPTIRDIRNWINNYGKKILKQQMMYPYQFNSIVKLYYK